MPIDTRCYNVIIRPFATASAMLLLFFFSIPDQATGISVQEAMISVSPDQPTTADPLVVTVTGIASCPQFFEPVVGNGTVDIDFEGECGIFVPPPSAFTFHALIEPLPVGTWQINVIPRDPPSIPNGLIASVTIEITDPIFSLQLTPSPATENDELFARVTGFASDPFLDTPEIEPGHIRLRVFECGLCDPPSLPGPFQIDESLGRLAAGEYEVELFFGDDLVAENSLEVLPGNVCLGSATALCLNAERFRVEATWRTLAGGEGAATAVEETSDTGLFWFFSEDNIELVVKVLDACDTEFESFWVFAGGLTDVGVTLTVTDTETGAVAVYENALGQPFETLTDTAAFATCP